MPLLETARLRLLPMSLAMLEARVDSSAALEDMLGVTDPEAFPLSHTLGLFQAAAGTEVADKHRAGDWGWYIIVCAARAVGLAGFKGKPEVGSVEIFYELIPEARGQGLATEAVSALCTWALEHGASRVTAKIEPNNHTSRRVLERCRFKGFDRDSRHAWFALER
jgi:RimJ/RimL family protein N-acetyltransferase